MSSSEVEIRLTAVDEASAVINQVAGNVEQATYTITTGTQQATAATEEAGISTRDIALAYNNMATSGMALYMSVQNVERAQVMLDRANLMVERSTETAEKAQIAYNDAVAKYGPNSDQAKAALDKLSIAQDALTVAQERQTLAQNNVNNSMMWAVVAVVPSLITAFTSLQQVLKAAGVDLVGLGETLVSALSNPITLIAAGVVAAGVAIYGLWQGEQQAAAAAEAFRLAMEAANNQLSTNDHLLSGITTDYQTLTTQIGNTTTQITSQQKILAQQDSAYQNCVKTLADYKKIQADQIEVYGHSNAALNLDIQRLEEQKTKLEQSTQAVSSNVTTLETQRGSLEIIADRIKTYNTSLGTLRDEYNKLLASSATDLDKVKTAFNDAFSKGNFDTATNIVTTFAAMYGISFDEAKTDIMNFKDSQERAITESEANLKTLTDSFGTMKADIDPNLAGIHDAFEAAFNAGDITRAQDLVTQFADQYGISFTTAMNIIEQFKAKQATVPQTIDEQLVGAAQAKFKEFQDCMSGKALTMSTDIQGNIESMGENITNLIANGLVGEAQSEMQAYVNCTTSKSADMVTQIEKDMTDLTAQHTAKLKEMKDMAETLTGAEKDTVLALIDQETTGYNAKMNQLHTWLTEILTGITNDAKGAADDVSGAMGSMADQTTKDLGAAGSAASGFADGVSKSLNTSAGVTTTFKDGTTITLGGWAGMVWQNMTSAAQIVSYFNTILTNQFHNTATVVTAGAAVFYQLSSAVWGAVSSSEYAMGSWLANLRASLAAGISAIAAFNAAICFAHGLQKAVDESTATMGDWTVMVKDSMDKGLNQIKSFNAEVGLTGPSVYGAGPMPMATAMAAAKPAVTLHFYAPIVNVEGSADKETAKMAAQMVQDQLNSVIIEATTTGAATKRVRTPVGL